MIRIITLSIIIAAVLVSQLGAAVQGFAGNGVSSSNIAIPAAIRTFTTTTTGTSAAAVTSTGRRTRTGGSSSSSSRLAAGSSEIVPGIGEEGCNLPSVSGINTKGDLEQAFAVKVIFLSLGAGTYLFSSGLHGATDYLASASATAYSFFRGTWPITFGAIYTLAGVTHFTLAEEYENIVPTRGAWGVWNIPGSRSFHVAWTGVAEIAGGLGLLAGALLGGNAVLPSLTSAGLESDAAAALMLLTIAVTPANIFMYTHGAKLPMDSEPLPLQFHAVRWVMQVVLLGFLYQMGEETFRVLLS